MAQSALAAVLETVFARQETGYLQWRSEAKLVRVSTAIESPYDSEARYSKMRDVLLTVYKVHLTETCDPDHE